MCKVDPQLVRQFRIEWCEFMLRKLNRGRSIWQWQVTKLGSINMIWKPRCSQWFGGFRMSPHPKNSKIHATHIRKWLPVSSENRAMLPPFLLGTDWQRHHFSWGQMDNHCGLVRASRSPEGLWSLVPVPPKDGNLWPFSSSRQRQCAHISNNGWLSQWERSAAAAAAPTVFIRLLSLWLLPIPRSEESTEGCPVWDNESAEDACWVFTRAVELEDIVEQVVAPHGKVLSCWRKVLWKKWSNFLSGESNQ